MNLNPNSLMIKTALTITARNVSQKISVMKKDHDADLQEPPKDRNAKRTFP